MTDNMIQDGLCIGLVNVSTLIRSGYTPNKQKSISFFNRIKLNCMSCDSEMFDIIVITLINYNIFDKATKTSCKKNMTLLFDRAYKDNLFE